VRQEAATARLRADAAALAARSEAARRAARGALAAHTAALEAVKAELVAKVGDRPGFAVLQSSTSG
jgi:hypothetical protein